MPAYVERQRQQLETHFSDQKRHAHSLITELKAAYTEGQGGRGTLDYLRIVSDPSQIANHYRSMLEGVQAEYQEFSRPPYAVDPLDEQMVQQAWTMRTRRVCATTSAPASRCAASNRSH